MVAGEASVDDVRQPSFQCSTRLFWSLGLGKFLPVVVAAGTGVADLVDRDHVNGGVELTIASPTEPVPRLFAAGGVDGRGAVEAGEVVGVGEPGNIASVADDLGGDDRRDAGDLDHEIRGRLERARVRSCSG